MSWFSGSGLGRMLMSILSNKDFQESALNFARNLGDKLLASANNPKQVQLIAKNLISNPQTIVGALVAGTEAESLVDPAIVQTAKTELQASNH